VRAGAGARRARDLRVIEVIDNPLRDSARVAPEADPDGPPAYHRSLPGYAPTRLIDVPDLAKEWGVTRVLLKFEEQRFGLPAFKFLGASWAARRLLGDPPHDPGTTLVAATDGNHGRAVARAAKLTGVKAAILVPKGTAQARIDAIAGEGATVEVVDGTYDDAVRQSAAMADDTHLVLSDTSWPGYEQVPRWVIDGYATIFAEVDHHVDVAVIPIGVGALAAAAARHYARAGTKLIAVEPDSAACLFESVRAGQITKVPGPHTSIMAGLNAGLPSLVAWPDVSAGFDRFAKIDDETAIDGMRRLAKLGIAAGEVSGGTLGAAALLDHEAGATVLVLLTEGVTDPAGYRRLVGAPGDT
jgi:diaminopropionate ammonia-lyase